MAKKKIELADRKGSAYSGDLKLEPDFFNDIANSKPPSGIIKQDDGSLTISNIRIHRTGLEFVDSVSEEEYAIFGETLLQIETAYQWIVGDYLAYGVNNNYGMAKSFGERLGRDASTIRDWTYVCNQVELSYRYDNLSFKHHRFVAPLDKNEQQYWLEQASTNNWSANRLRNEIAKAQGEALPPSTNEPAYKRWAEQSEDRAMKALANFRKEKDGRVRNAWKRFAESEIERWQRIVEEMGNE